MRSSQNEDHLSGAERIVENEFVQVLPELMWQAISSYRIPDRIIFSVDTIDSSSVIYTSPLDLKTIESTSPEESVRISIEILNRVGVSAGALERAFYLLRTGPAPGNKNMRGAVIMDAMTGERMEPDPSRGVRVSRVDYSEELRNTLVEKLRGNGIFHRRVMDAIAIATKVAAKKETVAELCWSDNPEYTTGYVASRMSSYVRILNMKEKGNHFGGRIFFVNQNLNMEEYVYYMEKQPVILRQVQDERVHGEW